MIHRIVHTGNYLLIMDTSNTNPLDSSKVGDPIAHLPLNGSPILEGVPLLPPYSRHQEEGVEELAQEWYDKGELTSAYSFKAGYNKAREKYKYTEEDIRKAIDMATTSKHDSTLIFFNAEEIIQYLHQYPTEFECEMEDYCGSPLTTERCPKCIDSCDRAYQRPKTITTAQGVQWVGKYLRS